MAENGQEAMEMIRKEKPSAAIVDYMLPVKSGIDICLEVRADDQYNEMKLIMFTGEENPEVRTRALAAGADEVVIKSPEVSVLVDLVVDMMHTQESKEKSGNPESKPTIPSSS